MPHRAVHLVLGILGLLAIATLVIMGASPRRHGLTGPRWKRRLVSAGLALMGLFGFGAAGSGCKDRSSRVTSGERTSGANLRGTTPVKPPPDRSDEAARPEKTGATGKEASKQIAAVTRAAEEIAAGKKGQYPFDAKGKAHLLGGLKSAEGDVDSLAAAGEINEGEAGLWKADLRQLAGRVQAFRTTEQRMTTCYQARALPIPAAVSLKRLRDRLPLVLKMATAKKLNPEVARRVLGQFERDLAILKDEAALGRLRAADQRELARGWARKAGALLRKIHVKLGLPPPGKSALEQTAEWKVVYAAWNTILPLAAESRKSTKAQRVEATRKITAATAAVDALAASGALTATEVSLLTAQAERLRQDMVRSPPADFQGRCYRRARFVPAANSLEHLTRRLPLLEKVVAAKKISAAVLARILPAVERDIATLTDPEQLKQVRSEARRRKARSAAKKARALVQKIRKLPDR